MYHELTHKLYFFAIVVGWFGTVLKRKGMLKLHFSLREQLIIEVLCKK